MEEQGFTGHHVLGGEVANLDSCLLRTIACMIVWISNSLYPFFYFSVVYKEDYIKGIGNGYCTEYVLGLSKALDMITVLSVFWDYLPFVILILKCSILVRLCNAYACCGPFFFFGKYACCGPYWDDSSFIITFRNRESMDGSFHIHKIPLFLFPKEIKSGIGDNMLVGDKHSSFYRFVDLDLFFI